MSDICASELQCYSLFFENLSIIWYELTFFLMGTNLPQDQLVSELAGVRKFRPQWDFLENLGSKFNFSKWKAKHITHPKCWIYTANMHQKNLTETLRIDLTLKIGDLYLLTNSASDVVPYNEPEAKLLFLRVMPT